MQRLILIAWLFIAASTDVLAEEGPKEDCLPEFGECDGTTTESPMKTGKESCTEDEDLGVCHVPADKKEQVKEEIKLLDCPKGFDWMDGTCIHFSLLFYTDPKHFNALSWFEAQQKCRSVKADGWETDLYSITSTSRLELINKRLRDKFPDLVEADYTFWTGAAQTDEGEWRWPNGEIVDPLSYIWLPNPTPKNLNEPRLLLVPADKTHGRLYALAVEADSRSPSFICEATPATMTTNSTQGSS
ncbi:uncharacterized protein LOC143039530 isoform X2 [Oratosquilla oratoria]